MACKPPSWKWFPGVRGAGAAFVYTLGRGQRGRVASLTECADESLAIIMMIHMRCMKTSVAVGLMYSVPLAASTLRGKNDWIIFDLARVVSGQHGNKGSHAADVNKVTAFDNSGTETV